MIYAGFNYVSTKNVVDIGPLEINREVNHPIQWSPVLGSALLLAGVFLIFRSKEI
jgi:hypothetical protein